MFSISSTLLHLFFIFGFLARLIFSDCPRLCECKWRDGKESVVCLNANLTSIPLQLDTATQVIDLTSNLIPNLRNDEFSKAGLLNLQKIFVSKCKLRTLEKYTFRNLKNLVELDLSSNSINVIPSHVFESIPELRELKLSGNPIQRIPNNAFGNLAHLIRLELSECKIGIVEEKAFKGLEKSLTFLKLDKNKLNELLAESISNLRKLQGLELDGNPWNCSCILRPLREWMLRQNVPFGVPPFCQHPQRLQTRPWDKLDLDEFACVPEIFAYESKAHGVEGRNITMTCRIAGIPEPNVRWLLKNRVIANLSGTSYSNGKKLYVVHLKDNSSNLTILAADIQDAGVYVCSAENKAGRAEASVTLAVSKKPSESPISNKVFIVSVVAGTLLALISFLAILCMYTVRKRHLMAWRRPECRNDDNYEKIELNHKVNSNANGRPAHGEISVVSGNKRNGEYRVVPGGDTDQEVEEEEDNVDDVVRNQKETRFWSAGSSGSPDNKWSAAQPQLDSDDLHIPRRTRKDSRDDFKRNYNSTSGTFNLSPTTSAGLSLKQHAFRSKGYGDASSNLYNSGFSSDLSSLAESDERKYPDLIENSSPSTKFAANVTHKANSEGGSVNDLTELFCTLPRKKTRYRSTDSQSPLLPESRYNSSGGSSLGSHDFTISGKLADSPKHSRNKTSTKSCSYLNLSSTRQIISPTSAIQEVPNATPLLDVSKLESRVYTKSVITPSTVGCAGNPNLNTYDYHAAQLERFLEEYRSLQKELTKMKETCDSLKQERACMNQNPPTPSSSDDGKLAPNSDGSNPSESLSLTISEFENDLTKYLMSNPGKMSNSDSKFHK